MQVTLINYTSDPELDVAIATDTPAYSSLTEEIWHNPNPQQVDDLLKHLPDSGYLSVLEYTNFTFVINNTPQVTSHQIASPPISQLHQTKSKMENSETNQ